MKGNRIDIKPPKKRTAPEIALWIKGYGLKDIADALGCKIPTVCLVIKGKKRSRRIEATIARTVDLPVEELFPGHGWPVGVHRTRKARAA